MALLDDLRPLYLFENLPDADLASLASVGEEVAFAPGDVLFTQGKPAELWWVLLDGRVELYRRAGREETLVTTMERPGQWAGGFLAWNVDAGYMATGRAVAAGRMFRVPAESLGAWARHVFPLGTHLIAGVFQTVRQIEAMAGQREALVALGTLAAGLAHEINNPAAAAARAVDALRETCDDLLDALVQLGERSLPVERLVALDALRREIEPPATAPDALAAADREDELADWLDARGAEAGWRIVPALAAADVGVDWCERAAAVLTEDTVGPGLGWVASTLSATMLLNEMEEAVGRVTALVSAVRSYSQLDRAPRQVVDVTEGLESTLVIMGHRLRDGVTVVREYGPDVPQVEATPGELNQVWTNLIDNAIDAMDGQGTLRLVTRLDGDMVVVEVIDTGPGMTSEVQAHAFEPFYTTKDVGHGTGLGLDICRRIVVDRHGGAITIASQPGQTSLQVRLPRRPPD